MSGTPSGKFVVSDSWGGGDGEFSGTAYVGPVAGLQSEYDLEPTQPLNPGLVGTAAEDNSSLAITSETPDVFILAGTDYADVAINTAPGGGNNVLNATGISNFLTGGSGDNTFYLDLRNLSSNVWDTISDAHAGDSITIWGVTPADFRVNWLNNQGAVGYTGLTAGFTASKEPQASFTLTGFTTADLTNGKLSISYGTTQDLPGLPGSNYMHVVVNS